MREEVMVELIKSNDNQHSLVVWQHPTKTEFVVCSYYDESKPMGSRWHWGRYFNTLENAISYWKEEKY